MSVLELVATILGIVNVALIIRQSIWCWPFGIAMVSLYGYIFFEVRLYSDMGLQAVYVFVQLYGWHYWLKGGARRADSLPVTRLSPPALLGWGLAAALGSAALGTAMARFTDADLAYWDAVTTVLSLIAQFLIARKKLENWLIWIGVDVLSIAIYSVKGLHLTAGLYAVFLAMATTGFFVWRQSYLAAQPAAAAA